MPQAVPPPPSRVGADPCDALDIDEGDDTMSATLRSSGTVRPTASGLRRSKLRIPTLGSDYLVRPRLLSALDRVLTTPLTLVTSPAGAGKTTLLAGWAATAGAPITWLEVDETDRDPG